MARYLLLLLLFAETREGQGRAMVYPTAESTSFRLTATDTLVFKPSEPTSEGKVSVFVDPRRTFQPLIGIGGALTDAAAETFAKLPAAQQEELITAYYSSDRGIGYTLGRTNINSCDFSSESYTYVTEGDSALTSFSVAHDLRFRIAHQARDGCDWQQAQTLCQSLEPAGVHEGQQRHAARRSPAPRVRPRLGPLLREVR